MSELNVKTDLRVAGFVARDQGQRPTCLSFALSDAHSLTKGIPDFLSVDYLFYYAVQRSVDKSVTTGTTTDEAASALREEGQPLENACPYQDPLPDSWCPGDCSELNYADCLSITPTCDDVLAIVNAGRPVLLVLCLSNSFFYLNAENSILSSKQELDTNSIHAVLAVGSGDVDGSSHLLIRNSWGTGWGEDGYCWLGEEFLETSLIEALVVDI